tara:strand:- start:451 stop:672 length:222 start_codon:yes stop_codon:yes gene_type:complete
VTTSPDFFVDVCDSDGLGFLGLDGLGFLGLDGLGLGWFNALAFAVTGFAAVGAFASGGLDRLLDLEHSVEILR